MLSPGASKESGMSSLEQGDAMSPKHFADAASAFVVGASLNWTTYDGHEQLQIVWLETKRSSEKAWLPIRDIGCRITCMLDS